MYQLIIIVHIVAAACIILLVLMQQGKGATIGSAFGSGASQTVFGSRGSGSFLLRVTISFAMVFFGTSLALNYIATKSVRQEKVVVLPPSGSVKNVPVLPISAMPVTPNSIPTTK
jgi:preprotein translocase subunit SecG